MRSSVVWEVPGDVPARREKRRRSEAELRGWAPHSAILAAVRRADAVGVCAPGRRQSPPPGDVHMEAGPRKRRLLPVAIGPILVLGLGLLGYDYFSEDTADEAAFAANTISQDEDDISVRQAGLGSASGLPAAGAVADDHAAELAPFFEEPVVAAEQVSEPAPAFITHVVERGDTLWDIAEAYLNDPFRYPELAQLSDIANPDLIYPGDIVRIPLEGAAAVAARQVSGPAPGVITHVVKKGDTLWDIAESYLNDPFRYPELAQLSEIANPDLIYPGELVRIPMERPKKPNKQGPTTDSAQYLDLATPRSFG